MSAQTSISQLCKENLHCRIIPIRYLEPLRQEIEELQQSHTIRQDLIDTYLKAFQFEYSQVLPQAQSIVLLAIPQPISILNIRWQEKSKQILIPPTYIYTEDDQAAQRLLHTGIRQAGFSSCLASLPLKLLAVRSGLSQYGRNNISYIRDLGSFYRLTAFVSDLPCPETPWHENRRMPECENCKACQKSCPTCCIDENRSIIEATQCLTYYNESTIPIPDLIPANAHNALIGCLRCQLSCPQNREHIRYQELNNVWNDRDVEVLLSAGSFSELPETMRQSFNKFNVTNYSYDVTSSPLSTIQRNLSLLLQN